MALSQPRAMFLNTALNGYFPWFAFLSSFTVCSPADLGRNLSFGRCAKACTEVTPHGMWAPVHRCAHYYLASPSRKQYAEIAFDPSTSKCSLCYVSRLRWTLPSLQCPNNRHPVLLCKALCILPHYLWEIVILLPNSLRRVYSPQLLQGSLRRFPCRRIVGHWVSLSKSQWNKNLFHLLIIQQ